MAPRTVGSGVTRLQCCAWQDKMLPCVCGGALGGVSLVRSYRTREALLLFVVCFVLFCET